MGSAGKGFMAAATAFGFLDNTENSGLWLDFLIFIIILFGYTVSIPGALAWFCFSSNIHPWDQNPVDFAVLLEVNLARVQAEAVLSQGTNLQDTREVLAWLQ